MGDNAGAVDLDAFLTKAVMRRLLKGVGLERFTTWKHHLGILRCTDGAFEIMLPSEQSVAQLDLQIGRELKETVRQVAGKIKFRIVSKTTHKHDLPSDEGSVVLTDGNSDAKEGSDNGAAETPQEAASVQKAAQIVRINFAWSEVNFWKFPFAVVCKKDAKQFKRIFIEEGQRGSNYRWLEIRGGSSQGFPTSAMRAVFMAIQKIVFEQTILRGKNLDPKVAYEFDSTQVMEELKLRDCGGSTFKNIAAACDRMTQVSFQDFRMMRRPNSREYRTSKPLSANWVGMFTWRGQIYNGQPAPRNLIHFSQFFRDSVNTGYVRPYDWDLWLGLGPGTIEQRLFEILDLRFYGLDRSPCTKLPYSKLCALMPIRARGRLARIREQFAPALTLLQDLAIIRTPKWHTERDEPELWVEPDPCYMKRILGRRKFSPEAITLAEELAKEYGDRKSLTFYRIIANTIPYEVIAHARSRAKITISDGNINKPAAIFVAALKEVLKMHGHAVPFGRAG